MEWTMATIGGWCGLCGARFETGARIALVTMHRKIRCAACATPPLTLDLDELDDDLPLDAPEVDTDGR